MRPSYYLINLLTIGLSLATQIGLKLFPAAVAVVRHQLNECEAIATLAAAY